MSRMHLAWIGNATYDPAADPKWVANPNWEDLKPKVHVMALIIKDEWTTTTTGTGNIALGGAVSNLSRFLLFCQTVTRLTTRL